MKEGKCERCGAMAELEAVDGDYMICWGCIHKLSDEGFWWGDDE